MKMSQFRYTSRNGWSPALSGALDSEKSLLLVFAAPEMGVIQEPLAELSRAFPRSHKLGCSTAGEISGAEVSEGGIVAAIVRFESDVWLHSASAPMKATNSSHDTGQQLARSFPWDDLRAILVLSEGISVNGSELVRGLRSGLPEGAVVVGGLAADATRFGATWTLDNAGLRARQVCAVGLYGSSLRVGYSAGGGWSIFGVERRVTRASGNVLYELDGQPALALYKEYLGERAADLPSSALLFPLALRRDRDDGNLIVRTILGVDESTQSLRFAGDVPEGFLAQLMRTNTDQLIQGAEAAARDAARDSLPGTAVLSLVVSCVGRRLVLGHRTDEETEATLMAMPSGSEQIGFYSYGEISPTDGGFCDLHNQTMTVTTLWEA